MSKVRVWRIALVVMILGLFIVQYQQVRLLERIAEAMAGDVSSNALTTQWKSSAAVTPENPSGLVKVVTKRAVGETDAALLVRHTAEVSAELEEYPIS